MAAYNVLVETHHRQERCCHAKVPACSDGPLTQLQRFTCQACTCQACNIFSSLFTRLASVQSPYVSSRNIRWDQCWVLQGVCGCAGSPHAIQKILISVRERL